MLSAVWGHLVWAKEILKAIYYSRVININPLNHFFERRVLVIGADIETINIATAILMNPYTDINIVGFSDMKNHTYSKEFLGKIKYIDEIVKKNKISEIIIREGYYSSQKMFDFIKSLKQYNLHFKLISKDNIILGKGNVEQISGIDLIIILID